MNAFFFKVVFMVIFNELYDFCFCYLWRVGSLGEGWFFFVLFFSPRSIWYVTQDVALGVSSCTIRCIVGALCMLYARSLELLGVAGTMLSNETAPPLLQKSETDESP